jgi:hypothetical protein
MSQNKIPESDQERKAKHDRNFYRIMILFAIFCLFSQPNENLNQNSSNIYSDSSVNSKQ